MSDARWSEYMYCLIVLREALTSIGRDRFKNVEYRWYAILRYCFGFLKTDFRVDTRV